MEFKSIITGMMKITKVLATIVPQSTLKVARVRGGSYVVELERCWLGRSKKVTVTAKEASVTEMNLLELL